MKKPKDFQDAVKKNNITEFNIRNCSICESPLYYVFDSGKVFYNTNCNCTTNITPLVQTTWVELAYTYNVNAKVKDFIDMMDKAFNF